MKKLLFGLAALPFLAGIASAADRLSDAQMDRITAGELPTLTIDCPACISSSSNNTSITTNGVTVATNSSGATGGSGGSTGGSGGATGGSGGSTGGSGGSTGDTGGSTGGSASTSETPLVLKVALPSNLVSIITATTGFSPVLR
jgi:hypothetical protein